MTVNDQQITDLNNKLVQARVEAAEARAKYEQVQRLSKKGGDLGSIAEALVVRRHFAIAHAVCRPGQERGRSREPVGRAASDDRAGARPAARDASADQRRDPAHLPGPAQYLRGGVRARAIAAEEPRRAARHLDRVRAGAGPAARIAARGGGQPHALRVVPRPLQGDQRAGKPGDAGIARDRARRRSDPAVVPQDHADARARVADRVPASAACWRWRCRLSRPADQDAGADPHRVRAAGHCVGSDGRRARTGAAGQARARRARQLRSRNRAPAAAGVAAAADALCDRAAGVAVRRSHPQRPLRAAARRPHPKRRRWSW